MIEKLKEHEIVDPKTNKVIGTIGCDLHEVIDKVNELVDAVNKLQTTNTHIQNDLHEMRHSHTKTSAENVQDEFAEQRKWIGKLCKFWDDDAFVTSKDWAFGILTSIDKGMQFQYCCNENCNFKHCEPVKPDDDIIYKGDNNEIL